MASNPARGSGRERLLEAAAAIVSEQGVHELTLEAVAAAAGVTKGGLIYHFKTKDELLGALVETMMAQVEERNRAHAAARGATTGALLQAFIDETFDMPPAEKQLMTNLLAAAAAYPHHMAPAQRLFDRLYGEFAGAGPKAGLALVIAAALDGISLLELMNLHQFSESQRKAMRRALQDLAQTLN
ncbi:TetR/AcrR family transcriptional regulator [Ideonella sp. YS5]|uniref:TetR/AcrR family transcriptional regulator n=1 Tax=Ideonella sp. YS5 TaxID=3453714 RepID=UPI003EEDAFB8